MMELGILLALSAAALTGLKSVYQRVNATGTDEFMTAWASRFFGIPVILAALFYQGVPDLPPEYFLVSVPFGFIIALTSILIAKAYKISDASLVTPMFAISPILIIFTSFMMLGEVPDLPGIIGILVIASGAYLLQARDAEGLLDPFRKLSRDRGVQIILLVVIIYSVTANIDKLMVEMSSPIMWPLTTYTLSSVIMLPVMMKKSSGWKHQLRTDWKPLMLLGVLGGTGIILQMAALELALVSYVISIKRLSIPITVVLSYFILGEDTDFRFRLVGSVFMAGGVILISI